MRNISIFNKNFKFCNLCEVKKQEVKGQKLEAKTDAKGEIKGEGVKGEVKGEGVKGEIKGEVKGELVKGEVKGEIVKGEVKGEIMEEDDDEYIFKQFLILSIDRFKMIYD